MWNNFQACDAVPRYKAFPTGILRTIVAPKRVKPAPTTMLSSLQKRRHAVAQTLTAALAVTWLSLFCQQCLAYAQPWTVPGQSEHGTHCQPAAEDGGAPVYEQSSCTAACDCSVMAATSGVAPPIVLLSPSASDPAVALPVRRVSEPVAVRSARVTWKRSPDAVNSSLLERFCIRLE